MSADLTFKFRFVRGSQTTGLFATQGRVKGDDLILGEDPLPMSQVLKVEARDNRLILVLNEGVQLTGKLATESVDGRVLVIEVYKVAPRTLEQQIERVCSAAAAHEHREALEAEGRGEEYREETCPDCQATIDLTGAPPSSYVYCPYCDSIFHQTSHAMATRGESYRTCDECELFDRVRGYTEFYFYFLILFYGFSYKRRFVCDNCAGRLFWRTFLWNFLFLLGIPSSIWIKIKSMTGRDPELRELARANALAKKGDVEGAERIYQSMEGQLAEHPGLKLNRCYAHLEGGDLEGAMVCLQESLDACPNYLPALSVAHRVEQAVGRVGASIEQDIFDVLEQCLGDFLVDLQLPGVDDAHVQACFEGMEKERAVHRLTNSIIAAE